MKKGRFQMFKGCVGAVMILFVFGTASYAESLSEKENTFGFDSPFVSKIIKNDEGKIVSLLGVNAALGISYRVYYEPVRVNRFNPYWTTGTIAVLIPFLGIGADYLWENGFYAGVGTILLMPEAHVGFMF